MKKPQFDGNTLRFEKNGRSGLIKKWGNGTFGTYFRYAGEKRRNTFSTFDKAQEFLDREFSRLDAMPNDSQTAFPVRHDLRTYSELEEILKERANGATIRDAVEFFLVHREHKKFAQKSVSECVDLYLTHQRNRNLSPGQIETLAKHFRHFTADFGTRNIHTVSALEISNWLAENKGKDKEPWSIKTRINTRGSLLGLFNYAQGSLNAIPDSKETEAEKVQNPKADDRAEVEIYTPAEIGELLKAALEHDIELIPAIVVGAFQGLRPDEFHAENAREKDKARKQRRLPLTWECFNWNDNLLHVSGQKVRSKATRDIPLHHVTHHWLFPFIFDKPTGEIWKFTSSYSDRMKALREKAKVGSLYDGFRHSYASYRIRQLKGDLPQLAAEMGNSPNEIVRSYKRNVTDEQANLWFNVMPPADYDERVINFLSSKTV